MTVPAQQNQKMNPEEKNIQQGSKNSKNQQLNKQEED